MRILWFTNDPLPAALRRFGRSMTGSGHWMPCLLGYLKQCRGIEIDVVSCYRGVQDDECIEDGVRYVTLGQPRLQPYFSYTKRDLAKCAAVVRERNPDLIHIHGSERFYGLLSARGIVSTPTVISMQGLLGEYLPLFFGSLSTLERVAADRLVEVATRRGLLWGYRDFAVGAKNEREILSRCAAFMGRTPWDRAQLSAVNPAANYFHVDEILRPAFSECRWSLPACEPYTVIFTNAGTPRRGTETLLSAMRIVRQRFPAARLRLAGGQGTREGYHRQLHRQIEREGLSGAVEYLGYLDDRAMAFELSRSHVFAIASHIENSPNSLCEAMQAGVPCVASYVGGIPSLLQDGGAGLLFPRGDAAMLAEGIMRIFSDGELAERLGNRARSVATARHSPARVINQLLSAYSAVSRKDVHDRSIGTASILQPR